MEGVYQAKIPNMTTKTKNEFVYYGDIVSENLNKDSSDKKLYDLQTSGLHALTLNSSGLSLDEQEVLISIAESIDCEDIEDIN